MEPEKGRVSQVPSQFPGQDTGGRCELLHQGQARDKTQGLLVFCLRILDHSCLEPTDTKPVVEEGLLRGQRVDNG